VRFDQPTPETLRAMKLVAPASDFVAVEDSTLNIYSLPVVHEGELLGVVVVISDASYIQARVMRILRGPLSLPWFRPSSSPPSPSFLCAGISSLACQHRALASHSPLRCPRQFPCAPKDEMFEQIHTEARHLAQDLNFARAAAQEEAQLRESQSSLWTPDRLRVSLQSKLQDNSLFVVSNREPYMHVFNERDHSIQMLIPPAASSPRSNPFSTPARHMDCQRLRQCRSRSRRLQRSPPGSARASYLHAASRLAHPGEDRGYYEGSPTKASGRSATSPTRALSFARRLERVSAH